jgi:hypothetical protein
MLFLAAGLASALMYAMWVEWVPLLPNNLYVPLLDLGKITGYTWQSALHFLVLVLGLFTLYALGYWLVSRETTRLTGLPVILAFSVLFCCVLGLAYPATAVDVFGYIAHGRLIAVYHMNPFITTPMEVPQDPILPYLAYPSEPSQYGPLWALVGDAVAAVSHRGLFTEIALYKTIAAGAHLASAAVVFQIASNLGASKSRANSCAFLYAWNPMLLWEMVGNAHNDGAMMLFGLVSVWLLVVRKPLLVMPVLAAGALVKAPLALIAPVMFVGLWRFHRARAVESALLAATLVFALYRPFWEGPDTLTALRRTDLFTASFGSVLRLGLSPSLGQDLATILARWVSLGAFAAVAGIAIFFATRATSAQEILRLAYFTLLGAVLLATTWFQAWYVVWPLAFGAALPEPRRHLEVGLLSLGGLLQYFVFIYLWVMGFFPAGSEFAVQTAAYLCIIGPLLVGIAIRSSTPQYVRVYRRA